MKKPTLEEFMADMQKLVDQKLAGFKIELDKKFNGYISKEDIEREAERQDGIIFDPTDHVNAIVSGNTKNKDVFTREVYIAMKKWGIHSCMLAITKKMESPQNHAGT